MITKDDIVGMLLEACPSFLPQWQAFQDEWKEEADLPLYLMLADFSRHLIGMVARGETAELPVVFAVVERTLIEGDHYVSEAITIGLFESLQNLNLYENGTEPEQFLPYLGQESQRWWNKVYRFWEFGELITDDFQ